MNLGRTDEARRLTDQLLAAVHSPITARPDPLVLHEMVSAIAELSRLCGGGKEPTEHLRNLHDCAHAMYGADARESDSRHARASALISIGLLRLQLLPQIDGGRAQPEEGHGGTSVRQLCNRATAHKELRSCGRKYVTAPRRKKREPASRASSVGPASKLKAWRAGLPGLWGPSRVGGRVR
jgi:hypothetical protein